MAAFYDPFMKLSQINNALVPVVGQKAMDRLVRRIAKEKKYVETNIAYNETEHSSCSESNNDEEKDKVAPTLLVPSEVNEESSSLGKENEEIVVQPAKLNLTMRLLRSKTINTTETQKSEVEMK